MRSLNDKVIFITGGASGIGAHCAQAYAKAGAKLLVLDKDETALSGLMAELGSGHISFCGNVQRETDIKNAFELTLNQFGRIDAIHNNAGIASPSTPVDHTSEEEWDLLFSVNLKSVYWTAKYGIESLKKTKGCILNTSSMVGEIGQQNHAAYVATKGGMNALTKAMALDYASFGIRVNAVCPGYTDTPLLEPMTPTMRAAIVSQVGMARLGNPDEIAEVVSFLASPASSYCTGEVFSASGGYLS
jgi:NAD(P)-dependent dehydrogenase (short-subunit alcohol dehydrogenase family)